MITLTRSHLKRLRAVFARGLGSSARHSQTPVQFRLAGGNLTIAVQNSGCAVLYTMPLDRPERSFAIPFEMFKQCEGGKNEPVTIEPHEQQVDVRCGSCRRLRGNRNFIRTRPTARLQLSLPHSQEKGDMPYAETQRRPQPQGGRGQLW